MLTEQELQEGLETRSFGRKIYSFEVIDSTNNCAKALAGCSAEEGTIVIAERQTAGRGRLGRGWTANPNENLTFSVVLRPSLAPEAIHLLPLVVAVAIADAIEKTTGLAIDCKWPNDLLVDRRKVAGILLEGSMQQTRLDFVVIGVGINVNQTRFPDHLRDRATSLKIACRRNIERPVLFREIVAALERHYFSLSTSGFHSVVPQWLSRSSMLNKRISVSLSGTPLSGIVKGVTENGGLILHAGGTEQVLFAGDVSILEGYA